MDFSDSWEFRGRTHYGGRDSSAPTLAPASIRLPTASFFLYHKGLIHVCGHSASHPSSIFMPCKQWPLATFSRPSGLGCTLNGINCPGENRLTGEACMSWEQVGDHPGKGLQSHRYRECSLKGDAQALPLALLTPHPTGRRMARGVPQQSP